MGVDAENIWKEEEIHFFELWPSIPPSLLRGHGGPKLNFFQIMIVGWDYSGGKKGKLINPSRKTPLKTVMVAPLKKFLPFFALTGLELS